MAEDESHAEPAEQSRAARYPHGRGYGNDYMRGGEVFGGYGYRDRPDYTKPLGAQSGEDGSPGDEPGADPLVGDAALDDIGPDGESVERFPQDERAGGWDVPHDPPDGGPPHPGAERGDSRPADPGAMNDAPVPQLERTFGDTGGNISHSRSYYVTQAQLQQRLYMQGNPDRPRGETAASSDLAPKEGEPLTG